MAESSRSIFFFWGCLPRVEDKDPGGEKREIKNCVIYIYCLHSHFSRGVVAIDANLKFFKKTKPFKTLFFSFSPCMRIDI